MSQNNDDGVIYLPFKDRVIERGRGCYNCRHFENGEKARQHWQSRRKSDRAPEAAKRMMDRGVLSGSLGLCMAGGVATDFVSNGYLCERYSGAEGSVIAQEGHAPDLLPGELKEKLGDKD